MSKHAYYYTPRAFNRTNNKYNNRESAFHSLYIQTYHIANGKKYIKCDQQRARTTVKLIVNVNNSGKLCHRQ